MSQHTLSGRRLFAGCRTKSCTSLFLQSRHTRGRYATTPLSFFLPCSFSFPLAKRKRVELLEKTHKESRVKGKRGWGEWGASLEDAGTPWLLHHYTGNEHPKQARPDLASPHARTQAYERQNIQTKKKLQGGRARKHAALQVVF